MKIKEEIILKAINEFKVDIWSNPKRDPETSQKMDVCEYCGKKHGKDPLYFHVNVAGTILPNWITEDDLKLVGMQSQGCFAIGSGCAKKLFGDKLSLYAQK